MKIKLLAVSAIALQLAACATVTRGTNDDVKFMSSPEGAEVVVTEAVSGLSEQSCVTPCEMEMKRKHTFKMMMTKDGYEPFEMVMESKVSTGGGVAAAGNLIAGGIIGGVVDGSSGAMRDFKPNPVNVQLAPAGQGESSLVWDKSEDDEDDDS